MKQRRNNTLDGKAHHDDEDDQGDQKLSRARKEIGDQSFFRIGASFERFDLHGR